MTDRRALLLIPVLLLLTCTYEEPPPPPPPPHEQGLQANEEAAAKKAIAALVAEARIAMVVTARKPKEATDFVYQVWSDLDGDGDLTHFEFHRIPEHDGSYTFVRAPLEGDTDPDQDPLADTSHETLATHAEELAASGGGLYVPVHATSWPNAFERISAAFDHKDAGDLLVIYTPTGRGGDPGVHGSLDIAQSRSPLLISGAGIKPLGHFETFARQTDIAPTVAKLLGVKTLLGKRLDGSLGKTYLKRQDGRVLHEVLSGSSAKRAILLVHDGMNHPRFRKLLEEGKLPHFATLAKSGVFFEYGSIGNFPTNTFPGHNTIGTGSYSGHHGLLDNHYYDRVQRVARHPFDETIGTSDYLTDEVETLFEALTRTYGYTYTVSINEPCTRGATVAVLDLKLPDGIPPTDVSCPDLPSLTGLSPKSALAWTAHVLAAQATMKELHGTRDPKLILLNLPLLDVIGHKKGPHYPGIDEAYIASDAVIGCILATLKKTGKLGSTLLVVTSDHGMGTRDPELTGGIPSAMRKARVSYTAPGGAFIYLKCLDVATTRSGSTLTVTVKDDDHDSSGKRPASIDATVTVTIGGKRYSATTDFLGKATFSIPSGPAKILVKQSGFTSVERALK